MGLTPQEQQELDALEAEVGGSSLSPDEEAELAQLEAEEASTAAPAPMSVPEVPATRLTAEGVGQASKSAIGGLGLFANDVTGGLVGKAQDLMGAGVDGALKASGGLFLEDGQENPYKETSARDVISQNVLKRNQDNQALEAAAPLAFGGARVLGSVAMPSNTIAKAGLQAGIEGYGRSESTGAWDQIKDMAANVGWATAPALALKGLGKAREFVGDWAGSKAEELAESAAGLDRTLGQRKELAELEKLGKIEGGETGRLLLDNDLVSLSPSKTSESIGNYRDEVGEHIRKAYEGKQVDTAGLSEGLLDKALKYSDDMSPEGRRLEKQFLDEGARYEGLASVPAETVLGQKAMVGKQAGALGEDTVTKAAAKARFGTYSDALKGSLDPSELGGVEKANREFQLLSRADNAAAGNEAAQEGKKLLRVGNILPAIAGGSIGGPVAGMAAVAGKQVLDKSGAAAGAIGLDKISRLLESGALPPKFQKVLQDAAARGGNALATTHFIMSQTDSEYQAATKEPE